MDKTESTIIKEIGESMVQMDCPVCGHKRMKSIVSTLELPLLGEAVQSVLICQECGFKASDVIITGQKEPIRYTLKVETAEDVNARIVRSTSGTIRMPELGIIMEPGPASESFISNIEGVLKRVMSVLDGLEYEKNQQEAVNERKDRLKEAVDGELPFTFIIEDPFGNSAVMDEKAEKEILTRKEADSLKTGETAVSLNDK